MTDAATFISRQFPEDPSLAKALVEGYSALSEGMTAADAKLGRYLRSFDDVLGDPGKTPGGQGQEMACNMFFSRHRREFADLLADYLAAKDYSPSSRVLRMRDAVDRGDTGNGMPCDDFIAKRITEMLDGASEREIDQMEHYCRGAGDKSIYSMLKWSMGDDTAYGMFHNLEKAWQGSAGEDMRNMYMDPNARNSRVFNEWLLHWTRPNAAVSIAKHGFDRGNTIGDLAYNRNDGGGNYNKYFGDYLFAFAVEDNPKIAIYGTSCVMFKGSGYRVWHKGDSENQVIFDYHEPTGCFLVMPDYDTREENLPTGGHMVPEERDYRVIGVKNGKPAVLYSGEGPDSCIKWVVENGDRMSSLMFKWPRR